MDEAGPMLETLTRRLAECPTDFLAEPHLDKTGIVHVDAVVADLIHDLGGEPMTMDLAAPFRSDSRNWLRTVLVACWLLGDPWFRQHPRFAARVYTLLANGLQEVSEVVQAPDFIADPDRREEFVRLCLDALGLRPAGESLAQAQDRLATLSSVERQRVIRAARDAEQRAQAIRDAMAKQAAEEAAAKYTRE